MRPNSGQWLVTTKNASYELDLDIGTVKRTPAEGAQRLAHDGLRMQLVGLFRGPTEGEPMVFAVQYLDKTEDIYRTSPVVGVDKLV